MLLKTSISLQDGETGDDLVSDVIGEMPADAVRFILEMYRSIYDESEPKQDTNEAGELLFLDANDNVVTEADVDAARNGIHRDRPGGIHRDRPALRPKYRPRTLSETHAKFAASWTHATWKVAVARKKELEARAIAVELEARAPAVAVKVNQ